VLKLATVLTYTVAGKNECKSDNCCASKIREISKYGRNEMK
jgi:hypothetical protein